LEIRIAGLVNDSIVDGPGLRLAVFTQGCPHHCPGCHNPQSHAFDGGYLTDTKVILDMAAENILLDGVTLSGGEPFAQSVQCAEIARAVRALGLNVWCYTGYLFEQLVQGSDDWLELLRNIDVLVDGPFIEEKRTLDMRFRGSSNQRVLDAARSLREGRAVLSEYN